jgi:hypothetical protein
MPRWSISLRRAQSTPRSLNTWELQLLISATDRLTSRGRLIPTVISSPMGDNAREEMAAVASGKLVAAKTVGTMDDYYWAVRMDAN